MNDPADVSERARARVGSVLRGKWHLDRVLGIGGTATVYAATHRNRSRAAIKILHAELGANREMVARFLREGYLGNGVAHPGTVKILDDDVTDEGAPFVVMELLDGESLGDRLERLGRLPATEVASVGCQLLDVLAAAHDEGIVHRDLKPDNVFVTRSSQLKVLDFGIARLREGPTGGASGGTLQGSVLGTPGFMAPEQALGRWNEVDNRTDIWAVGATLYTLLTGRFVHEADTVQEQLVYAATRRAGAVTEAAPDTPLWLARVIDQALRFEPAGRFTTAREMHAALRDAARGLELPPLSVPEKAPSLVGVALFPSEAATRTGESATLASVQGLAHSAAAPDRPRPRTPLLLGAAVLIVLVGAAAVLSGGRTPPGEEPGGSGSTGSAAGAGAPPAAPTSRTSASPLPSAELTDAPAAALPSTRPLPPAASTTPITVTSQPAPSTAHRPKITRVAKKPPAETSPPEGNPFDIRH